MASEEAMRFAEQIELAEATCEETAAIIDRAMHSAAVEMLERITFTLREYPHAGGDIGVMEAFEEKLKEARNSALEEAARTVETTDVIHGDHYAAYYAQSVDASVLAEAVRALKEKS